MIKNWTRLNASHPKYARDVPARPHPHLCHQAPLPLLHLRRHLHPPRHQAPPALRLRQLPHRHLLVHPASRLVHLPKGSPNLIQKVHPDVSATERNFASNWLKELILIISLLLMIILAKLKIECILCITIAKITSDYWPFWFLYYYNCACLILILQMKFHFHIPPLLGHDTYEFQRNFRCLF